MRINVPSLGQIAEECGVSKMTVSRALKDAPSVAESTKQRILKTAKKMNYLPLVNRKQDESKSAARHYVLFKEEYSLNNVFFSDIILSIQGELFNRGYACSFGIVKNEYEDFLKLYNMMISGNTENIIIVGDIPIQYLNMLLERFANVVLIDHPGDIRVSRPYNSVSYDNALGARVAVEHLVDACGRRRILLVYGPEDHYWSREVLCGYTTALQEHGLPLDKELIVSSCPNVDGGYTATNKTLDSGILFDAIFTNDEMAYGALKALKERGIDVPSDIAIVGFDGLPIAATARPSITTVDIDRAKMGRLAVERLLDQNSHSDAEEDSYSKIVLFPRLVVRESCGTVKNDIS